MSVPRLVSTPQAEGVPGVANPAAAAAAVEPGLVSIVIPCYNESKVLRRTLEHLLPHRGESRIEIIVSDDGSTDGTVEIARGVEGVRVVLGEGAPRSRSNARNRGAQIALGEVLVFIDADILIVDPKRFLAEVRRELRDPRLLAATVQCHVYLDEATLGDRLYHRFYNEFTWLANAVGLGTAGGWCQIVRREAFFALGGYDPFFTCGQDVDLFFRLRRRGRTKLIRSLAILESPRRYRAQGLLRTALKWAFNGTCVIVLRRPKLTSYPPIR